MTNSDEIIFNLIQGHNIENWLVRVVTYTTKYFCAMWFVIFSNISLAARAPATLLNGNHMPF